MNFLNKNFVERNLQDKSGVKDCCKNPDNLFIANADNNKIVRQCKLCGCRHIHMELEPGFIGLSM